MEILDPLGNIASWYYIPAEAGYSEFLLHWPFQPVGEITLKICSANIYGNRKLVFNHLVFPDYKG